MSWVKSFCGNMFWACVLVLVAVSVAVAQAAKGGATPMVIDQTTAFSWPILVLAVVSAAGYMTVVVTNAAHRNNTSIHLTEEQISSKHPLREMCDFKHEELMRRFDKLDADMEKLLSK